MIEKLKSLYEVESDECNMLTKSLVAFNNYPGARDFLSNHKGSDAFSFTESNALKEFYESMDFYPDLSGAVFGWWMFNLRYIIQNGMDAYVDLVMKKRMNH